MLTLPNKLVAIGLVAAALASVLGWGWMEIRALRAETKLQAAELKSETERADRNVDALNRFIANTENNNRVAAEVRAQRQELDALARNIMEGIANAPDADDAPLSPVMLDALERLRDAYDTAHGIADGEHGDPARIEDVRERNAAAADADTAPIGDVANAGSD